MMDDAPPRIDPASVSGRRIAEVVNHTLSLIQLLSLNEFERMYIAHSLHLTLLAGVATTNDHNFQVSRRHTVDFAKHLEMLCTATTKEELLARLRQTSSDSQFAMLPARVAG